jgi:ADP-heptose:LPS heptosyltransferase
MKILIISLAGIGDTLFATPLIHELRANFPEANIDALVLWQGSRDLLECNPHLTRVHQKNLMKVGTAASLKYLAQLRRNHYDVSINTHPQSRVHYRFVARLISARRRLSHQYHNATLLDPFLVNRTIRQDYGKHSIENNLAFLQLIGAKPLLPQHSYEIFLSQAEFAWADEFLATCKLTGQTLVGIHVGSGGTKNLALRRWPLLSYVELMKRLSHACPALRILLFGGPEEERDHKQILAQVDHDFVHQPSTKNLRQAAALLRHCHLFLSVDTALMHVAAAMKVRKQIVIETPTWNKPIEPYGNPFFLVKNPAVAGRNLEFYRYDGRGIHGTREELIKCMASVSVDSVYGAIEAALREVGH